MQKRILVIYPNSFPISGSATNRIISICLALKNTGNDVKVLVTRPTEDKNRQFNFQTKGIHKTIPFEYATKCIIWPNKKLLKMWKTVNGQINTIIKIIKENKSRKIDFIISAGISEFTQNLAYRCISIILHIKLIHTLDEYPWVLIRKENYSKIYRSFFLNNFYKLFDAYIVMTNTLIDYYEKICPKHKKFVHIPMTVDFDRFKKNIEKSNGNYVAYCGGDKTGNKDGIDILIKAFSLITNDYPNLKLYIIGIVHSSLFDLVDRLKLNEKVIFTGFVESNKIPQYLYNAKALCLARPESFQARGGFPTKLGEYLATGIPVIVTSVGEISSYLQDGINAYVAKPGDENDFAKKIRELMNNEVKAKKIGINGRLVAKKNFDYKNYSDRLNIFLNNLLVN